MLYITHEDGLITQSNKYYSFDEKDLDARLHDLGHKFLKQARGNKLVDPETNYVMGKRVRKRLPLRIFVDRNRIKAGGNDAAVLTGIPKRAKIRIYAVGTMLHELTDFDELELTIPVPCTYQVVVSLFPYIDFVTSIEAI